ncbi:anti-repressor SinI family protein [Cytobacillus oceanisediminis]|nr:anti-repressor SinI family protein [Cytobacillus oceanisediminis]MCC3645821.1 anti-repressor SinI family protein [Cytobacillus oceanisediminis]
MFNYLDQEWLELIQQAKELGLTMEEVKEVLILLSINN